MTTQHETELLAALKTELREICAAIDDPACDLTLTTVECIKKLKAENHMCNCEWRDIETAPKETEIFIGRFIDGKFRFCRSALIYEHANEFAGETWSGWLWSIDDCNDSIADCPTHWMLLPKPPAMAKMRKEMK